MAKHLQAPEKELSYHSHYPHLQPQVTTCSPTIPLVPVLCLSLRSQVSLTLLLWVSLLWMKHRQATGLGSKQQCYQQTEPEKLLDDCQGRVHCRQTLPHLNLPVPPHPPPPARKRAKSIRAVGRTGGLTRRKGMMLSLAMACNKRGAPVRLWRPAPHVEKKEPTTMTQGEGQAKVPTTRFLLTPSPYLQRPGSDHAPG